MRVPGSDGGWRVFISRTSEMREFPSGKSYVAEVERAITAAGHVIVDMGTFPAADRGPAQVCVDRVRSCEVYVGVLGTRYGSPVRDRPDVSYTELEFDAATEAGLDRLVFLLDTDADGVGIPPSRLIDLEFGERQNAFRQRVRDSELTTQSFGGPAELGQLVERSLRDLADTRRRIASGLQREKMPAEPQPVRTTRFVNPPPAAAPTWFQGRQAETAQLATYVTDPSIRLVTVVGRGGIGKTALVCRLLKGLEIGRIPDVDAGVATTSVAGIVYLSRNGVHPPEYPILVSDLLRLLPADTAQRLERLYKEPHHSPRDMMLAVLEAFPAGEPVVVLLDNLESVMDTEQETLAEPALQEALTALLTAPAHAVTVIATTRVTPTVLLTTEPATQRQLRLDEGLGSPDAENVLRKLDEDGRLGLRGAPDEVLDGLRQHTRGVPRALEAVKAILDGDPTLTPQDLLARTRYLPADRVVQVLVGEAYDLLDPTAQQVMQALSVYRAPVSEVAVDYLLRPVNPTTDAAPILTRLVRRHLVRFQDRHYHLHPIDRDYARSRLPPGDPGDPPAAFTLTGLQARAADYYTQIRTPRESWRTIDDVRPQLAEFELRCDTGDYETAAAVLQDVDHQYLQPWGHYRTLVDMHRRVRGRIANTLLNAALLDNLGLCYYSLGEYKQAIELHTQALTTFRDMGIRVSESIALANLGLCHDMLGNHRQAIDLHTQALAIARALGDRHHESVNLCCLGLCYVSLGDYPQALSLYTQALAIVRGTGDHPNEGVYLANLGSCHYALGEYQLAIDLHVQAQTILRDVGHRAAEGRELGNLGLCFNVLGEYRQAIELHNRALATARDIGDRYGEATALDYLGRARLASGDAAQAVTLLEQAVDVADAIGNVGPAVEARSRLARAYLQMDDPAAALAATAAARNLPYPTEQPTILLLEGLALLELHRVDDATQAFADAVTAAGELLALADRNVAALQARALTLAGVAATTGDATRATEAAAALTRLDTTTRAQGVASETRELLDMIAAHDATGVLAEIRTTWR
jgi:tetratricopeptide (TPR) repeat protein